MHDTLEDVEGYTKENLIRDCGERVAAIVEGVTHVYHPVPPEEKDRLWEILREQRIERLRNAPPESIIVKVADAAHNMHTVVEEFKQNGKEYLENFREPLDQKLKRADELIVLAHERTENPIVQELETALAEAKIAFAPFLERV